MGTLEGGKISWKIVPWDFSKPMKLSNKMWRIGQSILNGQIKSLINVETLVLIEGEIKDHLEMTNKIAQIEKKFLNIISNI